MKKHMIWLALCFGETLASNIKKPVRIQRLVSPYYNSSRPIATGDAIATSAIDTLTSTDIQVKHTSTSTDDSRRSDSARPTDVSGINGNTLHRTGPSATGRSSDCIDSVVTYTGRPPQTVYVTVDGSYEVPVSARNVSVTAPTIYETPLPACQTAVIPNWDNWAVPIVTYHNSNSEPPVMTFAQPTPSSYLAFVSITTVLVTKKTPVPVVQTPTAPPVTFQQPSPTTLLSSPLGMVTTLPQTNQRNPELPTSSDSQVNNNNNNNNSNNNNNPGSTSGLVGGGTQTLSNIGLQSSAGQSDGSGLASLINSVINSPFAAPPGPAQNQATPTQFVAVAATPTIDGVPVTIGPSSVIIGSQSVVLPTSSQTIVTAGTQIFTIRPSEIVAPGTTYQIESQRVAEPTITQAPSVVTTDGITMTINATVAIISGITYSIGNGANPATITIDSQTIVIGTDGVVFSGPSPTTFAPPMTIAGGREIVVADGLTISVDQTVAVISGTSYRIGSGAASTTVTVGGQTLTIGPSGVVLPSTTIRPTSVPTVAAIPTSSPMGMAQATSSRSQASGRSTQQFLLSYALTWIVALMPQLILCVQAL